MLFWKQGASRHYVAGSAALVLASVVVPGWIGASNALRHGSPLPPPACYASTRLEASERLRALPPEQQLPAVERAIFVELRSRCMERYEQDPFAQAARDRSYLAERPGAALRSVANELLDQLLHPSRPFARPGDARRYGGWSYPAAGERSIAMALYWGAAVVGALVLARRRPGVSLALVLAIGGVLLPAANSHLVGARLRYPADLLAMPLVAIAVGAGMSAWQRWRALRGGTS